MTHFICSDLHLNHRQIVKYCPNRVDPMYLHIDPEFMTEDEIDSIVDLMNKKIINNWNSVVSPKDDVTILGDVAMGQIKYAPTLIRQLNGNKRLVAGNHDKTLIKLIEKTPEYSDLFVWIKDYMEMSVMVDGKKHMVCMSHFPMRYWNGKNQGTVMLHGHLHGSYCDVPGRIFDCGIDTNNLTPYNLEDVVRNLLLIDNNEEHHKE